MDKTGIYRKTPQGQEEVGTRALKLPPKLRQLLIMVDGATDVASLAERFEQDNAIGHLIALEHMGLISMAGGGGQQTAIEAGAGANDTGIGQEDISELRIDLSHLVLDSLGPDASDLAMRIEDCHSHEELRSQCEACGTVIEGMLGKARADAFRVKAEAMLQGTSKDS